MDWNHNGKRDAFDRAMDYQIYEDIESERGERERNTQRNTKPDYFSSGNSFAESLAYVIVKIAPLLIVVVICKIIVAFLEGFLVGIITTIGFAIVTACVIKFLCYVDRKRQR